MSCDMYSPNQSQRPQRPKMPSFGPYEAAKSPLPSPSGPRALYASSRALQSILGGPMQPILSPISEFNSNRPTTHSGHSAPQQMVQLLHRPATPRRGTSKRSRDDFEDDAMMDVDDRWQTTVEERDLFQTPKRQRFAPLDMPLGLNVADFNSLPMQISRQNSDASNEGQSADEMDMAPMVEQPHSSDHSQGYGMQAHRSPNTHRPPIESMFPNDDLPMSNFDHQMYQHISSGGRMTFS